MTHIFYLYMIYRNSEHIWFTVFRGQQGEGRANPCLLLFLNLKNQVPTVGSCHVGWGYVQPSRPWTSNLMLQSIVLTCNLMLQSVVLFDAGVWHWRLQDTFWALKAASADVICSCPHPHPHPKSHWGMTLYMPSSGVGRCLALGVGVGGKLQRFVEGRKDIFATSSCPFALQVLMPLPLLSDGHAQPVCIRADKIPRGYTSPVIRVIKAPNICPCFSWSVIIKENVNVDAVGVVLLPNTWAQPVKNVQ